MKRSFVLLSSAALLAASASAQCLSATGVSTPMFPDSSAIAFSYPPLDEGYSGELPLGFPFTIGGVAYTHVVIDSNCEIYLTDGTASTGAGTYEQNIEANITPSGYGTSALSGIASGPRIVVHGGDNEGPNATSDILVDTSVAGEFKVTFVDWSNFGAGESWDCSVTLDAANGVQFAYTSGFNPGSVSVVGLTAGGGLSGVSSDLSAGGDSGVDAIVFESGSSFFDLSDQGLSFVDNVIGGYSFSVTCMAPSASNTNYGTGCYDISTYASAYQQFLNAASAEAALEGTALSFTPNGVGYTLASSAATFVAPTAGIVLALGDDAQIVITPSAPFNYLGTTPVADLHVCSNGFISMAAGNSSSAYGSVSSFNNASVGSFRSNLDLNPAAAGSGPVVWEESGGVVYVTYDATYRWNTTDAETLQFQLDLASGVVTIVWQDLSNISSGDMIVGFHPGAPVTNNPIDFQTDLPFATTIDATSPAIGLSASPTPVSTATTGTLMTYAIDNVPLACPAPATVYHFGLVGISAGQDLAGTDLLSGYGIDAPGCNLYLTSLDISLTFVGAGPNQTVDLQIPAGVPVGIEFFAQAVGLVCPGTLPNGLNNAGLVTSNGVASFVSAF